MIVLIFIAVQIAINGYLYATAVDGIGSHSWIAGSIIGAGFLCLTAALLMERTRWMKDSVTVSQIGYNWMGIGFLFMSLALVTDFLQLFLSEFSDRQALYAILPIGSVLSVWGMASARQVNVRNVRVSSSKIETPFTIAQISDLHLSDSSSAQHVKAVVNAVNERNPDLIVSTGDLFDGYLALMQPYVTLLQGLNEAPYGKFAVSGNHEYYAGLEPALELTRQAGFTVLKNQSHELPNNVTVVGIDDLAARGETPREEIDRLCFENADPKRFTLFLNHRPSIRPDRFDRFDLQLSGHTHGGQIFPFHILSKLSYSAKAGLSEIAPNTYLYLSRGTGAWGPQLRVFAPPEITFFTITPEPET